MQNCRSSSWVRLQEAGPAALELCCRGSIVSRARRTSTAFGVSAGVLAQGQYAHSTPLRRGQSFREFLLGEPTHRYLHLAGIVFREEAAAFERAVWGSVANLLPNFPPAWESLSRWSRRQNDFK